MYLTHVAFQAWRTEMKDTEVPLLLSETNEILKKEIEALKEKISIKDEVIKRMKSELLDVKHELSIIDGQDLHW
jgi:isocitrate dehydrogenase